MVDSTHHALLMKGVKAWNSWRAENNATTEIDLSGVDLDSANLKGIDLSYANLRGANLSRTYLASADLRSADLSDARLCDASLPGALLSGATLVNADLDGVILTGAVLEGADLNGSRLTGVDFTKVYLMDVNLTNVNLASTIHRDANFSRLVMRGANLRDADLAWTPFIATDLRDADLRNADLISADLTAADLSGADLSGANLMRARLLFADLTGATLTGACIEDWQVGSSTNLENINCDYIFRAKDENNFSKRLPVDGKSCFAAGEFTQRFQILESASETIDLTFSRGLDWLAFFESFQEVCTQRPLENISIQAMERKGKSFVIRLETQSDSDRSAIESEIKQSYSSRLAVLESRYEERLKLQGIQVKDAQQAIQVARKRETSLLRIIETMAENKGSKYEFNAPVGNVVDTAQSGSRVQSILHNYSSEQRQTLSEAAEEIQMLLKQLSESYEITEVPMRAVERIKHNPQMRDRVISALKSGGKTALEELIDHPAVSIVLSAIEGANNPL